MRIPLLLFLAVGACGAEPAGDVYVQTLGHQSADARQPRAAVSDVEIIGVDIDGTTSVTTSTDGLATLWLHAGASVTAVYTEDGVSSESNMETRLDVRPGDTYVFGDNTLDLSDGTTSMTVTYPALPGALSYDLYDACGPGVPFSNIISHSATCKPAAEVVTLFARTDHGAFYGTIGVNDWHDGGTIALDAWHPASSFTLAAEYPAGTSDAQLDARLIANGTDVAGWTAEYTRTATVPWMPGSDGIIATARATGDHWIEARRVRLDSQATSYSFAADTWLPVAAPGATFDPTTEAATFDIAPDPRVDATVLLLDYQTPDLHANWRIVAPPDATSVEVPMLPVAYETPEPLPSDEIRSAVMQWDFDDADGYDDARARPSWDFDWQDTGQLNGAAYALADLSIAGSR